MRPKLIITLGLLTIIVLGAALFLKWQLGNTPPVVETASPTPPAASNVVAHKVAPPPRAPVPVVTNVVLSAEDREAAISAEVDRLQDWSMNDDAESLNHIVADLTSPEKQIREAAIEATKQFGSADAIPSLKAAAESTEDIEDKIAFLEAANFLSLPAMETAPTTLEQIAQRRAEMEARRQAQKQRNSSGQNQQATPGQNPPGNSSP